MAAKAALVLAFRKSALSHVALVRRFGVDDKVIRRLLAPHHGTAITPAESSNPANFSTTFTLP